MRNEREAGVEPIRVKIYGLVPRTRRRYLIESALALGFTTVLFIAWWLGWPVLHQRFAQQELPPFVQVVRFVLEWAPEILLVALAIKLVEMMIVLRCFTHRETAPPGR
jgi:hypothetical protein